MQRSETQGRLSIGAFVPWESINWSSQSMIGRNKAQAAIWRAHKRNNPFETNHRLSRRRVLTAAAMVAQRRASSRISAGASTVLTASSSDQPASIRKRKQQLLSLPKLTVKNRNVLIDLVQWMEKAGRIATDQAIILLQKKKDEIANLQQTKAVEEQRKKEQEDWERKMAEKKRKLEQRRAEQEARKKQLEEERLEQIRLEKEAFENIARVEQERAEAARLEAERIERERLDAERVACERIARIEAEERERAERLAAELEAQAQARLQKECEEAAERERQQKLADQKREEEERKLEKKRLEMERKKAEAERREQERIKEKSRLEGKARLKQAREIKAVQKREAATKQRREFVKQKEQVGLKKKALAEEEQKRQATEANEAAKRQKEEKARKAAEDIEREAIRLEKGRVEAEKERLLKIEQRIRVREERIKVEGERLRAEKRALKEKVKQERDAARERKRAERQAARERTRLEAARLAEEEQLREARLKEAQKRVKAQQAVEISTKQHEPKRKQVDDEDGEASSRQIRSKRDKSSAVRRGRKPKEPVHVSILRVTKETPLPKKRAKTKLVKKLTEDLDAESSLDRLSIFETPDTIKTKADKPTVLEDAATPVASAKCPTPAAATTVRRAKRLAAKESAAPTPQKYASKDAELFAEPKVESWTLQFLKTKNLDKSKPAVPLYNKPVEVPLLVEESPLTKAKKLDAENQRRQRLLSTKNEAAKKPGSSSAQSQSVLDDFGTTATPPAAPTAIHVSEKPIEPAQKPFKAPPSKPIITTEHPKPVDNPFDHVEFVAPSNLPIRVGRMPHPTKHTPAKSKLLQAAHAPMIDAEAPPADLLRSVDDEVVSRQVQTAVAVEATKPPQQQPEVVPKPPPPLQQPLIQQAPSSESDDVFETSKLHMQHGVEPVSDAPPANVCESQNGSEPSNVFAKKVFQPFILI